MPKPIWSFLGAFVAVLTAVVFFPASLFAQDSEPIIGRIKDFRSGKVSTQVPGLVKELRVRIGDEVKKGSILAVLDTSRLESEMAQAEGELAAARAKVAIAKAEQALKQNIFARQKRLKRSAAFQKARYEEAYLNVQIAKAQVRAAEADVKIREASLRQKKLDIALSTIRAPYNGTVMKLFTQVGSFVTAEAPHILELVDNHALEIEVDLSAEMAERLKPGEMVTFQIHNSGKKHKARLRAILPQVSSRTQTRPVRFSPHDPTHLKHLAVGQNVSVFFANQKLAN